MSMYGYFDVFPEKSRTELRTAAFQNHDQDDPLRGGTFLFTEYFCTDLKCDCQRVLVKVLRTSSQDSRPEEVATISYTWHPDGDETFKQLNLDMPNPFLDPFHRQVSYASHLLDFWSKMVERDKAYAARIRRHYDEIRAKIGRTTERREHVSWTKQEAHTGPGRPLTRRTRKARKRRSVRGRKRK